MRIFKEWDPADGRIGDEAFIRPNALDMKADGVYRVLLGATRRENATLLANAGMNLPNTAGELAVVQVKPTVPLLFDGRLDDWTNDMDDINLSEYSHADPIALTAADRAAGTVACDLDYSALVYLLHDRQRLYLGGMVISRGAAGQVELQLDDRTLALDLEAGSLAIDGMTCKSVDLVVGRQPAGDVIDTRLLNLTVIHQRIGKAEVMPNTPGTTFEAAIPWTALGMMQPPAAMTASLRLCRPDGATLQKPLQADGGTVRIQLQFASRT